MSDIRSDLEASERRIRVLREIRQADSTSDALEVLREFELELERAVRSQAERDAIIAYDDAMANVHHAGAAWYNAKIAVKGLLDERLYPALLGRRPEVTR